MLCSRARARCGHRQRGQTLIEFALVAPVLIVLAFGIFDLGRAESANVTVTNSAREGARRLVAQLTQVPPATVLGCPGGTVAAPQAPAAATAQGAAWRQMANASLDLTRVTLLDVRVYSTALGHDPTATGVPDYEYRCAGPPGGAFTASQPQGTAYTPVSGDWVAFEVAYTYAPMTPVVSGLLSSVSVDQTATMVLE